MGLQLVDVDCVESGLVVVVGTPCRSCGGRCRGTFEVVGADVAQGGMTTIPAAPALDEIEDGHARFGLSADCAPVDEFALQSGEEALGHGIGQSNQLHAIDPLSAEPSG